MSVMHVPLVVFVTIQVAMIAILCPWDLLKKSSLTPIKTIKVVLVFKIPIMSMVFAQFARMLMSIMMVLDALNVYHA